MFAAPRRSIAIAALSGALTVPSPASASPFTDAVETAVFSLCPGLRSGEISPERPRALTHLGYRRTPEVEEDWADAEDGAPFIFVRAVDGTTVAYWPYPQACNVIFRGDQADAALAQVKARISRQPRVYRRVPEAEWSSEQGRHEAWRLGRRGSICLTTVSPSRGGEPMSHEVSFEPFPPLHPGLVLSGCTPARAPQIGGSPS